MNKDRESSIALLPNTEFSGGGDLDPGLHASEVEHSQPFARDLVGSSRSRTLCTRFVKIATRLTISILAILGMAHIIWTLPTFTSTGISASSSHPCSCGDSVAEAISLNCKFDSLAAAWLPPKCRDEELTAKFDISGPGPNGAWSYFSSPEGTKELNTEEIGLYADSPGKLYWATHEWHLMHCFFYWRKLVRSRFTGVIVEPRYDNEAHAVHCSMALYKNFSLSDIVTHQGVSLSNGAVKGTS